MSRNMDELAQRCVDELREGTLTEEGLRRVFEALRDSGQGRQQLLYLQSLNSSVTSDVVGMSMVKNGQVSDRPLDPEEWPYQTVLEAMNDGWRVIRFPETALMLDESRTYGLGCEFILERCC